MTYVTKKNEDVVMSQRLRLYEGHRRDSPALCHNKYSIEYGAPTCGLFEMYSMKRRKYSVTRRIEGRRTFQRFKRQDEKYEMNEFLKISRVFDP